LDGNRIVAERFGLSAYDATYLELAYRLGLPLGFAGPEAACGCEQAWSYTLDLSSMRSSVARPLVSR
jgi:hypothetical protein